ncbi:MAG: DEAD/DEAH box helicase, partial [Methylobacter sp.]|nr:DEAD/DEAH box helicase [Methylobacter sp.]
MQPNPIDTPPSFSSLALDEKLLMAVNKMGFEQPTPVQAQAIPPAMERKDLLVSAETGSGKTAAFLLPTLHHLIARPTFKSGARVLVL